MYVEKIGERKILQKVYFFAYLFVSNLKTLSIKIFHFQLPIIL